MTDEEITQAAELWQQGHTVKDIAKVFSCTVSHVRAVAESRRHIFQKRDRSLTHHNGKTADNIIQRAKAPETISVRFPPKAPGYDGVLVRDLDGGSCCFPLWGDHERFDIERSLYCGARRKHASRYCQFHCDAASGKGTRSERNAEDVLKKFAGPGVVR